MTRAPRRIGVSLLALGLLLAAVLLSTWAPAPAVASPRGGHDVTAAEAADLARAAITSDPALARLRSVETVDGRPVDLRAATGDLGPEDRAARLRALVALFDAAAGRPPSVSATAARQRAHDVVNGKGYKERALPKPFKGVIHWLGDELAPVGRFLARLFRPIGRLYARLLRSLFSFPGGRLLLDLLLLSPFILLAVVLIRRRTTATVRGRAAVTGLLVDPDADPAQLDAAAEDAEARGDLDLAVRRRYEAGLVRAVRAGRIHLRPETTPTAVAEELGGAALAAGTVVFEEVVYGGRPAVRDDIATVQTGWLDILGAKARR